MVVIHKVGSCQIGQLHTAQYNDVQQRKEHSEVSLRSHPELNVRHALEGALNLTHTFYEAHRPQQRQEGDVRSKQIAHQRSGGCRYEQGLVGEAKLHAEQQRKIDGHAAKIGVKTHLQVFAHKRRAAHHLIERTEVKPSRQLKRYCHEDVNPGL